MANGTTGMMSTPAGGASSTDINSTLKNIVSNIGQEAMAVGALNTTLGSTLASSVLALQGIGTSIANIYSLLSTALVPSVFGGMTAQIATGTVTAVISDTNVTANSVIASAPANHTASISNAAGQGFFIPIANFTAGASFSIIISGGALGGEQYWYIGFNT